MHRKDYEDKVSNKGCVFWFSGLSGAGKSTISQVFKQRCLTLQQPVIILDGDVLRRGLCSDLGFTTADRSENIRRASEVAAFLAREGHIVVCALISPYNAERAQAGRIIGTEYFHNVYIKADIATCIARDPKGLYKKAISGEIPNFTGISDPFEAPENPHLILDTRASNAADCVESLIAYAQKHKVIKAPAEALA
jgi:adenylyl-sulfate kinase